MIVEIISIGTELLLGDIIDTNSTYIAEKLTENGFDIHYVSTVGDNLARITATIKRAQQRADIIITTGGLGPTDDDLTREAIAASMGLELKKDERLLTAIKNYFREKNYSMTVNNEKQACLPEGATEIPNEKGTAPGILLERDDIIIISMPGVPGEMKDMLERKVLPYLKELSAGLIQSKVLNFFGIGESSLEMEIKDILDKQTNPTIALLAGKGEVKIRITSKASSKEKAGELIAAVEKGIRERVGEYVYGSDDKGLAVVVAELLKEKGLSIATAESCTGGLLGDRITNIAGSSEYFQGGVIAYSNQVKHELLGVEENTLKKYGAVSAETAQEMAEGIKDNMSTDIGIAITGIAGPGGGSQGKPVGLVYLGLAIDDYSQTFKLKLRNDRAWNKWMSTQYALYYLYRYLVNGQEF
ncbi:competence/damage-inducible protein A [Halocella sp. SP3-1]|uniref:competence/damage-inducible protein A n=1 Tax=Halocella sp. SP3-1 TaxID=2382161 RepID=UPI000F756D91|nr:competence/damage-inducible protein A [Halocella sp. SP3-1]AZO95477.1 competence/damage-inducible protein A [Halocella sp. SP3-1]